MQQEKLKQQFKPGNYSFTIVPDYFFRKLINVMGAMPGMIYLTLLSYCHKKSYMAWPSLNTMSRELGIAKTTIIRNLNILIKLNFIKNITRDTSCKNYYQHNVYQLLPPEEILFFLSPEQEKNTTGGSAAIPPGFQNATGSGSDTLPQVVAERYPNNNNLNNNNITTTKRDVVVDFKKLKEKGEEKMQAVREQLRDLDIEGKFIEQLLKDYPQRKIEKKLDLLKERRNIKSPAGWLRSALKNDYQGEEQGRYDEEPVRQESRLSTENKRFSSKEEALQQIQLAKRRLDAIIPSYQIKSRWQKRKGEDICQN